MEILAFCQKRVLELQQQVTELGEERQMWKRSKFAKQMSHRILYLDSEIKTLQDLIAEHQKILEVC